MTTYLDHASTTPMSAQALAAYCAAAAEHGNPSSLHSLGRRSRRLVEEAREKIARLLDARPSEVIFTSGGTEADNLAVKGIYWARRDADGRNVIVASPVEHHAVLDAVKWLAEHESAEVAWLPVDAEGVVSPVGFEAALSEHSGRVALATVMWANNEIGTLQSISEFAAAAAAHEVPFHTDAVQAVGQIPVSFERSRVDSLAITGHKLGGPVGVGALLLGRDVACVPVSHGGGQERSVRSGTLDLPGIAALAAAVEAAVEHRADRAKRLTALRDDMIARVLALVPDAVLNGPVGRTRLPGNVHFTFPGCEGDTLLMLLDAAGVACSTGSACTAGVPEPSHVLLAMGRDSATARESLRFSLGETSTAADVDALIAVLGDAVARARRAGAVRQS